MESSRKAQIIDFELAWQEMESDGHYLKTHRGRDVLRADLYFRFFHIQTATDTRDRERKLVWHSISVIMIDIIIDGDIWGSIISPVGRPAGGFLWQATDFSREIDENCCI